MVRVVIATPTFSRYIVVGYSNSMWFMPTLARVLHFSAFIILDNKNKKKGVILFYT